VSTAPTHATNPTNAAYSNLYTQIQLQLVAITNLGQAITDNDPTTIRVHADDLRRRAHNTAYCVWLLLAALRAQPNSNDLPSTPQGKTDLHPNLMP